MSSSTTLLEPPSSSTPAHTLHLSQQAPSYLKSTTNRLTLPWPLSFLTATETQETWSTHENLFLATLRSGDNTSAQHLLDALDARFGLDNERVAALRGLAAEATAKNEAELEKVMGHYEEILKEDPGCFAIRKRRIALLRSLGRTGEAVGALVNYVDSNPTDAEGWRELAEVYVEGGEWERAVFALEEVLLLLPNAWNAQARMGEVVVLQAQGRQGETAQVKGLSEGMRRFARSVELCDWFLRGWFGLKVTTSRLLGVMNERKSVTIDTAAGELPLPSIETVRKLNQLSTSKLAEIVRRSASGEKGWDGFNEAELIAARALLDQDTQKLER